MNIKTHNFIFFLMMLSLCIITIQSLQAQSYEMELPNKTLNIKINLNRYRFFSIDHHQERVTDTIRIFMEQDTYVLDHIFLQLKKILMLKKQY